MKDDPPPPSGKGKVLIPAPEGGGNEHFLKGDEIWEQRP